MKDLDKGKCVRPARSARRGTDRLNEIAALSEKSAELTRVEISRNWRDDDYTRSTQAGTENADLENQRLTDDILGFFFFFECSNFISSSAKVKHFQLSSFASGNRNIGLHLIFACFLLSCS